MANENSLSAEAAEFVPTHEPSDRTPPTYLYNCYPFVTEHPAGRGRGRGSSMFLKGEPGMPHARPMAPRLTSPQNSIHTHIPPPRIHGPRQSQQFYPQQYPGPPPPDIYTRGGGKFYHPNAASIPHVSPVSPLPHQLPSPHQSHPIRMSLRHSFPGHQPIPGHQSGWRPTGFGNVMPPARPILKSNQRNRVVGHKQQVSVGTQNEYHSKLNRNRSQQRSVAKTIILMDMAVQTDFSDEIANHTLEQIPNALYQGKRKSRRKTVHSSRINDGNASTDSEVDHSDSGYSSPMHRKNLISSGTDAQAKGPLGSVISQSSSSVGILPRRTPVTKVSKPQSSGILYSAAALPKAAPRSGGNVQIFKPTRNLPEIAGASIHSQDVVDNNGAKSEGEMPNGTKKRKRKRGRRRRKNKSEGMEAADGDPDDDPEEGYSPIPNQESPVNLLDPETLDQDFPSFADAGLYTEDSACSVTSGRRKKKRDQANKRAIVEQLEIDLEQQAIKVVNQTPTNNIQKPLPPPPAPSPPAPARNTGRKSQQSISINIMDILFPKSPAPRPSSMPTTTANSLKVALNPLDSTAPSTKRGKERETPRVKKKSKLKKVILKEREEKKRLRCIGESMNDIISTPDSSLHFQSVSEHEDNDEGEDNADVISDLEESSGQSGEDMSFPIDSSMTPVSQDMSPISQNSPISELLSPASGSLSHRACDSPTVLSDIAHKIHSRRFREYCNQVLDKEIDGICTNLLHQLYKFQDKLYHKDPIKARSKRRLILGLREVTKHLNFGRVKMVVISPNLEKIQSKGGLDDILNMIMNLCSDQNVPFVFALGRRSLGRVVAKIVPVSIVGILNYQGAEQLYRELITLTKQAREAYHEMVAAMAKEVAEYGARHLQGSSGLFYSHMGHSRTPSGCSAISFASSIVSEPAKELQDKTKHYSAPTSAQAEIQETSSKPKEAPERVQPNNNNTESKPSSLRTPLIDDIYDIDEGNEADTEDNDLNSASTEKNQQSGAAIPEETKEEASESNANVPAVATSMNALSIEDSPRMNDVTPRAERRPTTHRRNNSLGVASHASSSRTDIVDGFSSVHSTMTVEGCDSDAQRESVLSNSSGARSIPNLDRVKNWVREVDNTNTTPKEISQDDKEFNATYSACAANTDVLISRSRSPSVSLTQP